MADYKVFYKKGVELKYFPDDKVLVMEPKKGGKDDFLRLKSKLDTILQITGTKRSGNSFSLKLDDSFNVNVDEVLKSLGMKGGIEHEDAQSMVDDQVEEETKDEEKEQTPEVQGAEPAPQMEWVNIGVYNMLFESDAFAVPQMKKRKETKRFGKYWNPIEAYTGKNKNAITTEDVLTVRKKFSLKPFSEERNQMLRSLDKAANYFYNKLKKTKGIDSADEFHEKYLSVDDLKPEEYEGEEEMDSSPQNATMSLSSLVPDFEDVDYSDIHIEKD